MPTDDATEAQHADPQGTWGRVRKWLLRASVAGLLISLTVHVGLLIMTALLLVGGGGGKAEGDGPAGVVEFAVMPESEFEQVSGTELAIETPEVDALLQEVPVDVELTAIAPDGLSTTELTVEIDAGSGGSSLDVEGVSGGGGGGGAASFFGIEARGSRFAYVVDISGSMGHGGKLDATLSELSRSITEMMDHVSFYVVFYSDDAFPLANRREWTDATGAGKRWARGKLESIEPLGSTHPVPAFELVKSIRPRADAIYFMTDGDFQPEEASQILALNRDHPVPIHCITFVDTSGEARMKQIAEATGGTYTHVPGRPSP